MTKLDKKLDYAKIHLSSMRSINSVPHIHVAVYKEEYATSDPNVDEKKRKKIEKILHKGISQVFDNYFGDERKDLSKIYSEDWANKIINELEV